MNTVELPSKPPLSPKIIEERLKLGASGLQATALTILGAVVLAPELNSSLIAPLWVKLVSGALAGNLELSAFLLLGYIPTPRKEP